MLNLSMAQICSDILLRKELKMKKGIKKIIASALVLMMILAMVPSFAFADGEPSTEPAAEAGGEVNAETKNEVNAETGGDSPAPIQGGISAADPEEGTDAPVPEEDEAAADSEENKGGGISSAETPITGLDEDGNPIAGAESYGLIGDIFGGEGSDVPLIGYSKFVYVTCATVGEGAETWAKINVVKEGPDDKYIQLAHGAFPVDLALINGVGIYLSPYARENGYTIKKIEADHGIITALNQQVNYASFTYYTWHISFTHSITVVLDGGPGEEPGPDTPDNNINLLYISEGKAVDYDSQPADKDGKASFTIKPFEREGYTLKGWMHETEVLQPGDTLVTDHDDTVTAVWEEIGGGENPDTPPVEEDNVILTYDLNGGTGGPKKTQWEYKKNFIAPLDVAQPAPTHADVDGSKVVFMGWKAEQHPILAKGDTPVYPDLTVLMDTDKTVYALYGFDKNNNDIPDVYELGLTLRYLEQPLGVTGTGPADRTNCTPGEVVAVDYETEPTPVVDNIVFLYWTDEANALRFNLGVPHIFGDNYNKEDMPEKISNVKMDTDRTLFAVWAYDNNMDGIPDFNQKPVEVKYDPNKGYGGPVTETVVLTEGKVTEHELLQEPQPTHDPVTEGEKTVPVLFVGWTEKEPVEKILEGNDKLPENYVTKISIPYESEGETVYALWGYDRDGNGTPDINEKKWHLTYDPNTGKGGPGTVEVVQQAGYVLETENLPTHDSILNDDVLFYGWTSSRHLMPLTAADKDKLPEDIVETIDIYSDKTVYALWALDKNKNGIPDVEEEQFTLTFDVTSGIPESGPEPMEHLVKGETVNLALALPRPEHEDSEDGVKIVLAGWSETPHTGIWDKGDILPEDFYRDNTLVMPGADKTVYAVYGYDRNNDGTADVVQELVYLTYDPLTGTGGPGTVGVVNHMPKILEKKNVPVHDDVDGAKVLFAGWTLTPDEHIYEVGDDEPDTSAIITIDGDTTVYAVYGYDRDGNGKPDIDEYEKVFVLSFDPNGGESAPDPQYAYSKNGKDAYINITSELPVYTGKEFKGWAQTPGGLAEFRPGQKVKLENDVTLYAVWGAPGSGGFPGGGGGFPGGGIGGKPGVPKTGDESNTALWVSLAALSVIGMGAVIVIRKKHSKNTD